MKHNPDRVNGRPWAGEEEREDTKSGRKRGRKEAKGRNQAVSRPLGFPWLRCLLNPLKAIFLSLRRSESVAYDVTIRTGDYYRKTETAEIEIETRAPRKHLAER